MVTLISPDNGYRIFGYAIYIVRAFQKNIAPKKHFASLSIYELMNLLQKLYVDGVFSSGFDLRATPSLTKFPRFVEAYIELLTSEVGEELIMKRS